MLNKKIFLSFLLLSLAAVSTHAEDLEDAVEAMRAGDFAEAYCIMRPLAEDGDADAQYNIGWMYLNGYGLRINDSLALEWWKKAVAQGHSDASFSIGMLYSLGEGEVPKNSDKAIDYYLIAADAGHEDALAILKNMLQRDDRFIRNRLYSILRDHEAMFGVERIVKARKLNARNGPSIESKIVSQLLQGEKVLEVNKQGLWSQIVILADEGIKHTVWVYNPLLENEEVSE